MYLDEQPSEQQADRGDGRVLYRLGIDTPPRRTRAPHPARRVNQNRTTSGWRWGAIALGGAAVSTVIWSLSRRQLHHALVSGDSIEPRRMPGTAQDIRVDMDIRR